MKDPEDELRQYEAELAGAREDLNRAQDEHQESSRKLAGASKRYEGLSKVVAGLREIRDAEVAPQAEELPAIGASGTNVVHVTASGTQHVVEAPRGREAVLRILSELDRPWRVKDLAEEIERRGWIDPDAKQPAAAVSIAVRRLRDSGHVQKVGAGTYRLAKNDPELPIDHPMGANARVIQALRVEREGRED